RVLVTGGLAVIGGVLAPLATAEVFDPADGSFHALGGMGEERGRTAHTATLLPDGRVLLAGGWGQAGAGAPREALNTAALFDPARGTFANAGQMANGRANHTATLLLDGERVLLTGGRSA